MKDILRSRLSEALDDLANHLLSSLKDDLEIIDEDILGTIAHDYMLFKQGILSKNDIALILKALLELRDDVAANKFVLDNNYEDIHPLIEAKVIEKIGIEAGGKIHSGRSRNDQVAVDIRLKLRDYLISLQSSVLDFIEVLLSKAKKHIETPFPLYTHLQPAQIGTLGHLLVGWAFEMVRHATRLSECFKRTNLSPLGACAIGGTSFPINRALTAELLGFSGLLMNSMDAISSRDILIENASNIAQLSIFYSRIAEDLILYSSNEFQFINLPDKFCSVSSVLPQKKNPDTLELIRGKAANAVSTLQAELVLAKGTPSGYNRDFQDCKPPLWRVYPDIIVITKLLARIIADFDLRPENIKSSLERSDIIALDLAEYACLAHGVSFRKSHELLASIVKYLQSEGKHLASQWSEAHLDAIKVISMQVTGKSGIIDEKFLRISKKLDSYENRKSSGSPAPEFVKEMISIAKKDHDLLRAALLAKKDEIRSRIDGLFKDIKILIGSI